MESQIFIEGVVGDDWFTDNPVTLAGIRAQIQEDTESITLHINSPGGYVDEAWAIHDYIRTSGKKTKAIINGTCASAATVIVAAADEVEITQNSQFMIHLPWVMTYGNSDELRETVQLLEDEERKIARLYADITGKNIRTMLNLMREEKFWDADRAVSEGFADRVIKTNNKKKKVSNISAIATLPSFTKEMKVAATIRNNQKYNTMNQNEKGLLAQIKALFEAEKPAHKNLFISLGDGREMEVKSEHEVTEPAVGDVVTVDNKTPEDDTYVTVTGDEITTENGVITSIETKEQTQNKIKMDEVKALQNKIAELENTLAAAKEANDTMKQELTEKLASIDSLKQSIEAQNQSMTDFQNKVLDTISKVSTGDFDSVPNHTPTFNSGDGKDLNKNDFFAGVQQFKEQRAKAKA